MAAEGSVLAPAPVAAETGGDAFSLAAPAARARAAPVRRHPLDLALENAEHLLNYAVEAGIELEPEMTQRIIAAKRPGGAIWDGPEAGAVLAAITKLAAKLHPVTAETLRACREEAQGAIRDYKRIVMWLAGFIIPLSMISFIYTAISNSITADLKTANDLIVTLHAQLDTPTSAGSDASTAAPSGTLAELQQFAATMRAVYSHTRELNWFILELGWDPYAGKYEQMQLPTDLKNSIAALQQEVNAKTQTYQKVRSFATDAQDDAAVFWGAVGSCILPVLYALLGACAYVLRSFTEQTERRTFAPSYATPARFIIAAIGGGVVGLFSNFTIGQGLSLSPLAAAFLIGYAADIFFSFLEGSLQNFRVAKAR